MCADGPDRLQLSLNDHLSHCLTTVDLFIGTRPGIDFGNYVWVYAIHGNGDVGDFECRKAVYVWEDPQTI